MRFRSALSKVCVVASLLMVLAVAVPLHAGTGEGVSGSFSLYLGPEYSLHEASVSSADSPSLPVYLGPRYELAEADIGSANSSSIPVYLGPRFELHAAGTGDAVGPAVPVYLGPRFELHIASIDDADSPLLGVHLGPRFHVLLADIGEAVGPDPFNLNTQLEITGVVRTEDTGAPLGGATVELWSGGEIERIVSTNNDGEYTLPAGAGIYDIRAYAQNHLRAVETGFEVTSDLNQVDLSLQAFHVSDDTHLPNHYTHWRFDQDQTISWSTESTELDSIAISVRTGPVEPWVNFGFARYPASAVVWPAAMIPDVHTVSAELEFRIFDAAGDQIGTAMSERFALYAPDHFLLTSKPHVFAWPDGPPNTDRFRIRFTLFENTTCSDPRALEGFTSDAAAYVRVEPANLETMERGRWQITVTPQDASHNDLSSPIWWDWFTVNSIDLLRGDGNGQPVILVHGWTDDQSKWDSPNEIADVLEAAGFDVWTFSYPSVGYIEHGAGGLGRAIAEVLTHYSSYSRVYVIGHSMGGLVSRAYIQGLASAYGVPYGNDIGKLVTLGTPHNGAPSVLASAVFRYGPQADCRGVEGPAIIQLSNEHSGNPHGMSNLLTALNDLTAHPLDPAAKYLFVAGDFPSWDPPYWDYAFIDLANLTHALMAEGPNDAAVSENSAHADLTPLTVYDVSTETYLQDHSRLARFETTELKSREIVAFLNNGTAPGGDSGTMHMLTGLQASIRGAPMALFKKIGWVTPAPGRSAASAEERVMVWAGAADSEGRYVIPFVPDGEYELEVLPPGYIPQRADVSIDASSSGWQWNFELEPDPSYVGPKNASISINSGAVTTSDTVVSLTLAVTNATEMIVSNSVDFAGATWEPIATPVSWTIAAGAGYRAVYAKFRDGSGRESVPVSDHIRLAGSESGSIVVTSSVPGAAITLNGTATGRVTPATIPGLGPGDYWVAVTQSGYEPAPGHREVAVVAGQQAAADFTMTPKPSPDGFALVAPASGAFVSARPRLEWRSSRVSSGTPVYYRVTMASDTSFSDTLLAVGGLSDTTFTPANALADSASFAWRVTAVSVHDTRTVSNTSYGPVTVDALPPVFAVTAPENGDTWETGDTVTVSWSASDFSGIDSLVVSLSVDGGFVYERIGSPEPAGSSMVWVVPDSLESAYGLCRIRVSGWDLAGNTGGAQSGYFSITATATDVDDTPVPREYALHQNVPNPFNPRTVIRYDLPRDGTVSLRIYDVRGRLVRTLVDGFRSAGARSVFWDGTNGAGHHAASGIYFYRLTAPGFTDTRKMLLLE